MLSARIKKQPFAFISWIIGLLLPFSVLYSSCHIPAFGNGYQFVCLKSGTVMIVQNAGLKSFEDQEAEFFWLEFGDYTLATKLRDFFRLPQQPVPGQTWIPLGIPFSVLLIVTSWRFWRRDCEKVTAYHVVTTYAATPLVVAPECGKHISQESKWEGIGT